MEYIFNAIYHSTKTDFKQFSLIHFFMLLLLVIALTFIIVFKKQLCTSRNKKYIRICCIILLIIQQCLMYSWYYFNNQFSLDDTLPIYPCRIAEILCILVFIQYNEKLIDIIYYVGIAGAILALIFPDTNNLNFPNAMFIQFFLGHGMIIFTAVYFYVFENYRTTIYSLLRAYKFGLIYTPIVCVVNLCLNSNYSYLRNKPPFPILDAILPAYPFYIPILIGILFTFFAFLHYIYMHLNKRVSIE